MRVRCEQCGTSFRVAPPPGGAVKSARRLRFRCEGCDAMILVDAAELQAAPAELPVPPPPPLPFDVPFGAVYKPSPEDPSVQTPAASLPKPLPPEPEPERTDDDNSLLIKNEGKVYQAEDLSTVQRWIVERRVMREDMISKDGQRWEPVGHRGELEPFFSVMERLDMYESRDSESFIAAPPLPGGTPMGNAFVPSNASVAPEDGLIPLEVDDPSDLFGEIPEDEDSLPRFDTDQAPAAIFVPSTERETPFDSAELMEAAAGQPLEEAATVLHDAPKDEAEPLRGDMPLDEAETVRGDGPMDEAETIKGESIGVSLDDALGPAPTAETLEIDKEEAPVVDADSSDAPVEDFFDRGGEPIKADLPRWEESKEPDTGMAWVFGALVILAVLALIFWPRGETPKEAPPPKDPPAEQVKPAPTQPEAAPEVEPEAPEVEPEAPEEGAAEPEAAPEEPEASPEAAPEESAATPPPVRQPPRANTRKPEPVKPPPAEEADIFAGKDVNALINAGWDGLASGDFDLAQAMFHEATNRAPSDPRAHYGKGYIAMKRGNEPLAKREICTALSLGLGGSDAVEAKVFVQRWGGCQ